MKKLLTEWRKYISEEKKRGLWANIAAKRKRGEKPAKPGDADYPDKKSWKKLTSESEEYYHISDATYEDGTLAEDLEFWDDVIEEAEYQGRKVELNKPMQGDVKKSKVYVKNKKGNVVKVNFGDPDMKIKKSNPEARSNFRARHNCADKMKKGDKTTAGYWSCKAW